LKGVAHVANLDAAMSVVDCIFLSAVLLFLAGLLLFSQRVRIIVKQSLFHPLEYGHIAIWDDEVVYFDGRAHGLDPKPVGPIPSPRSEGPDARQERKTI
jgi:hypothetical protein